MSHAEHVVARAMSPSASAQCGFSASWVRSLNKHKLDPADARAMPRLGEGDLRDRCDSNEVLLHCARRVETALFQARYRGAPAAGASVSGPRPAREPQPKIAGSEPRS